MRDWHADLAITAFGKITAVYGHINENGRFIRNWLAWKMAITDKMVKNSWLSVKIKPFLPGFTDKCSKKRLVSVNHQHNGQKFTDKPLENACLSVKCVLLTDKSSKTGALSVILPWISAQADAAQRSAFLIAANLKRAWFCRKNREIIPFADSVIELENRQKPALFFSRIDVVHVGILVQEAFSPDFVYFQGYATMRGYGQNADFWNLPVKSVQKQPS